MADDWQPGDLALCVRSGPSIRKGVIDTVLTVFADTGGLLLANHVSSTWRGSYKPCRFRKIRPHTPDAEDAETIRLLTGTPVREPVA